MYFNTEEKSFGVTQRICGLCSSLTHQLCVKVYLLIRVTTVEVCDATTAHPC